jgi:DNA-binding response OmpR family regulator
VNVMVAQSMLMKLGHTLEVANNGADAIQALQQNSYDLILMVVVPPMPSHVNLVVEISRFIWDPRSGPVFMSYGSHSDVLSGVVQCTIHMTKQVEPS